MNDPDITVSMPLSHWHVVIEHLRRGICGDVENTLASIYVQAHAQMIEAAQKREAEAAAVAFEEQQSPRPPDEKPIDLSLAPGGAKVH